MPALILNRLVVLMTLLLSVGGSLIASDRATERVSSNNAGTAEVLAALVNVAKNPEKPAGDELFLYYVRSGADAALKIDKAQDPVGCYLIALASFFDPGAFFLKNAMSAEDYRALETAAPERERIKFIGTPSLQGRHDLALHFALSAGYCESLGSEWAKSLGILKENMDARRGGSGFSFVDLAADFAGVEFALRLQDGRLDLKDLSQIQINDLLPNLEGLEEGIFPKDLTQFQQRVKAETINIQRRIAKFEDD
ncbi:hypothetical protein ACWPKO_18320 [Coraliomargarita sp. W4R53]